MQPDVALFGEKDYQQLLVIRRMVRELCMPVEIVGIPIMREADGLAMSSRNEYLGPEERNQAPLIYKTLVTAAANLHGNPGDIPAIEAEGLQVLEAAGFKPEYFCVRRSEDLGEAGAEDRQLSILVAAWLGSARLIDNIKIDLNEA